MISEQNTLWHKPAVYWTIAGFFLLVSVVTTTSITAYMQYTTPPNNSGIALNLQIPGLVVVFSVLTIPSIIGAIKLFNRKKSAMVPSILALLLWACFYLLLVVGQVPPLINIIYDISGSVLVCLDVTMIAFVIIGQKKMFRSSRSHLPQNNSEK